MSDAADDIFHGVVGHDGAKAIVRSALRHGDINILLEGPPGSGKSVFLEAIEQYAPDASYHDAAGYTDSELRDAIAKDPGFILLDEFDAMKTDAYDALSLPMEHGRVTKDNKRDSYDVEIDTQFFAACNGTDSIPSHIVDRYRVVEFQRYTDSEFIEVCRRMLPDSVEWVEHRHDAEAVARTVLSVTGSRQIREVRDVAQLAGNINRVEPIALALDDTSAEIDSEPLTPSELHQRRKKDSGGSLTDEPRVSKDEWFGKTCPHISRDDDLLYHAGHHRCADCTGEGGKGEPYYD